VHVAVLVATTTVLIAAAARKLSRRG